MVRFRLIVASLVLVGLSNQDVCAGDGFPPFGAWVYGTGHVPVTRVRHVGHRRAYPGAFYGWGGYGNIGFAATTRFHYSGFYGRPWYYHRRPAYAYRVGYPSFFYHSSTPYYSYPVYSYPVYSYPVYSYPVYSYPVFVAPTCAAPATISVGIGYALAGSRPTVSDNLSGTPIVRSSFKPTSLPSPLSLSLAARPADTSASARLVATTDISTIHVANSHIPAKTLHVADTMLRVGGYREAAQAYARLSNMYGTTDLIYGRRFVAQVAAGDLAQAEVIVELAEASGFAIHASDLPGGNVNELLEAPVAVASITEKLAARALQRTDDPLPLKSVANWLMLAGDQQRASIFFKRANQLEQLHATPVPDGPAGPQLDLVNTVLASFE